MRIQTRTACTYHAYCVNSFCYTLRVRTCKNYGREFKFAIAIRLAERRKWRRRDILATLFIFTRLSENKLLRRRYIHQYWSTELRRWNSFGREIARWNGIIVMENFPNFWLLYTYFIDERKFFQTFAIFSSILLIFYIFRLFSITANISRKLKNTILWCLGYARVCWLVQVRCGVTQCTHCGKTNIYRWVKNSLFHR